VAPDAEQRTLESSSTARSPSIDELLPARVREVLEERFWRPIEQATALESLVRDPTFLADPVNHPGLFSDHGVVHVRNIAAGFFSLASTANGVLLPGRPPERQAFLTAYGLLATYLHDIGMHDQSRVGRMLHPLYAAHVAFESSLDDVIGQVLSSNGVVVRRLQAIESEAPFACPHDVVLREMLSLSMAHSKSTVPATLLDDRPGLRRFAQRVVLSDLDAQRARGSRPGLNDDPELTANTDFYERPLEQSFAWLTSGDPAQRGLADDVVDALRALRAADALRQRGTALKTTAGYEIFIDAASGQAVFSLRTKDNSEVYLLRGDSPKSAGEANLRMAAVTRNGHLRFAFHRGAYLDADATGYAAECTAVVVGDILEDVLDSFSRQLVPGDLETPALSSDEIQIQLERPGDAPTFADDVARLVVAAHPRLADRVLTVADLEGVPPEERARYHAGVSIDPRSDEARSVLEQLEAHGTKVAGIDVEAAFADVRRVRLRAGEVVVSIGSPASFVYVATGPGLRVQPGGGYRAEPVSAWVPVGTTGVIRRAERNAEVTVDQDVEILMIPGECYARVWFRPYSADELVAVLGEPEGP
jgi:hypothetical protein